MESELEIMMDIFTPKIKKDIKINKYLIKLFYDPNDTVFLKEFEKYI